MPRERSLAQRVRALERSLSAAPGTDRSQSSVAASEAATRTDQHGVASLGEDGTEAPAEQRPTDESDASRVPQRDLESRLSSLEAEVAELSAGLQALRGYVGNIEHVNDSVERRANAALAAVERLESSAGTPPLASLEQDLREEATADEPMAGEDADANSGEDGDQDGLLDRLDALR